MSFSVAGSGGLQLVWPSWQRALHGVLAASIVVALITHEGGRVHEACGYLALAAALLRVLLGFAGPRAARFRAFVRAPAATFAYARALLRHAEPHHLNHNPLGAWMVLLLLTLAVGAGISGAIYVTDRFWGEAWVIGTHAALAWPFAALVPLHLLGVAHASWRQRENLVAAMWWHGRKRERP